jgi:hypothetical protein
MATKCLNLQYIKNYFLKGESKKEKTKQCVDNL